VKFDLKSRIEKILEKPVLTNSLVLGIVFLLVIGTSLPYYLDTERDFIEGVLQEAHGMIFDIAIIGILIFWLNEQGRIRQQVRSYKDEIDDFRMWESEEAAFRNVGNIKRLNRFGINELNLVNCYLAKTNLPEADLSKSNLNSANLSSAVMAGGILKDTRMNQTNFENANLNNAYLSGSFASGANFKDSYLIKAEFNNSFLIKANFTNAYLMESDLRNCHLTGAEFKDANLYKADLRGAKGLTIEQLSEAKSLYLAQFDDDITEKVIDQIPELVG
jgi:uncharacterized protein YjbI with pentapeptide repeats